MRFVGRLSATIGTPAPASTPRVLVRRESIWSYPAPTTQGRPDLTVFPPGRLLVSAFVVYSTATDVQEFEDAVVPIAASMRDSRAHVTVGFVQRASSFDASFLRYSVERCHALGLTTLIELAGTWSLSSLEVLWTIRPRYLRIGPEHLHGVTSIPEQYQSLARLAEFARTNGIPLIARGVQGREERSVLRTAGIELFHVAESGPRDEDPLMELDVASSYRPPTVLRFPLRPPVR